MGVDSSMSKFKFLCCGHGCGNSIALAKVTDISGTKFLYITGSNQTCGVESVTGAGRLYPDEKISAADALTVGAPEDNDDDDDEDEDDGFGFRKSLSDDLGAGGGGFDMGTVEAVT